ncbi:MAG: RNA polymerase sigma factor (sigma-70 family) [Pseudoalteromonas distincta]
MTEKELIKGCVKNKREYQKALYDMYASDLLSICFRYFPDINKANDVLQEVFIKVFRSIKSFAHSGSFEGWLKRITVNTAINELRKEKKHQNHTELDDVNIAEDHSYDDSAYILSEIVNLSELNRNVFNLFSVEGYSAKETAEILGISEANVRVVNHRAKKILKVKLEKYFLEG